MPFSWVSALRNLVLPWGAVNGPRIILNGTTGAIDVFDANGERIKIDSATGRITAGDVTGTGPKIVIDGPNTEIDLYGTSNENTAILSATGSMLTLGQPANGTGQAILNGADPDLTLFDVNNVLRAVLEGYNGSLSLIGDPNFPTQIVVNGGTGQEYFLDLYGTQTITLDAQQGAIDCGNLTTPRLPRPLGAKQLSGAITLTGAWQALTGCSITFNTTNPNAVLEYSISFDCEVQTAGTLTAGWCQASLDSVATGPLAVYYQTAVSRVSAAQVWQCAVANAGSHTLALSAKKGNAGTAVMAAQVSSTLTATLYESNA